jgi:hypothetical protein
MLSEGASRIHCHGYMKLLWGILAGTSTEAELPIICKELDP